MGRPPKLTPAAAEGSTAAAGGGRNAQGTGEKLQRRQIDDFETKRMIMAPKLDYLPDRASSFRKPAN